MLELGIFANLGRMVIGAAVVAIVARALKLPTIVAYLLAGLVLGPLSGLIEISEGIETISELGIVLLLFLVGLELNIQKIREVGMVAVVAGLGQVLVTTVAGFGICLLLGFGRMESFVLSLALTFSSTVVVVKVLTDLDQLDSLYGRIAVGLFLVQDLVVILVLTILTGLPAGGGEIETGELVEGMAFAIGGMALLLGGVLVAAKFILPKPMAWAAASPGTLFIWSLFWCLLVVTAAHLGHLSMELGAFFAGLSLAQFPFTHDLQHRIKPLMNFFVAIFFVSLGVKMQPGEMGSLWLPGIVLSAFVLIGNPLILLPILSRFGYSEKTSFKTSITVAQISEFSFIFVPMAVAAGLVGTEMIPLVALIGMITMALSAYLILYSDPVYGFFRRTGVLKIFRAKAEDEEGGEVALTGHIIVIGMNTLGRRLVEELVGRGETVLAIDTDPRKLRSLKCQTLQANVEYRAVLEEHGLANAKLVISALQIEDTNDLIAYRCKQVGVPSCIHAIDLSVMENLLAHDVSYFMLPKVDAVAFQRDFLKERGLLKEAK